MQSNPVCFKGKSLVSGCVWPVKHSQFVCKPPRRSPAEITEVWMCVLLLRGNAERADNWVIDLLVLGSCERYRKECSIILETNLTCNGWKNKSFHGWSPQLIYSCFSLASDRPQFMVDFVNYSVSSHPGFARYSKNKQSPALPFSSSWIFFNFKGTHSFALFPKQYPMSNSGFKWAQYLWEFGLFPSGWRTGPDVFV